MVFRFHSMHIVFLKNQLLVRMRHQNVGRPGGGVDGRDLGGEDGFVAKYFGDALVKPIQLDVIC